MKNKTLFKARQKRLMQRQAKSIIANAKAQAAKMLEDARVEAEALKKSTFASNGVVNELMPQQNTLDGSARRYFIQDRLDFKKSLEEDLAEVLEENRRGLGKAEEMHHDMCSQTNQLQASWVNALADAVNSLTKIKEEFYGHLHSWQVALYPHELRPLAQRYIELYQIVSADALLREESLWKLNKTLTAFLHKFELSLNGLDMYVFYPGKGENFDAIWHMPEDDRDFDETVDYRVSGCIVPGVAKKAPDSEEDDVIIPATVSVDAIISV